jgi:hypothetical protein
VTLLLIVLLVIFLVGGVPQVGWHSYGYGPLGVAGVVLLVLLLAGRP